MASLISSKISQGSGTSDGHFGDRDLETSKRLGNLTNLGNLAPGSRKSDTFAPLIISPRELLGKIRNPRLS